MGGVDWLPAIVVLAIGVVLGLILVYRTRGAAKPGSTPRAELGSVAWADLRARRDSLLDQLRELEDTAAKREPEQLARERYALELEAASVLLEIAARESSAAQPSAEAVRAAGRPPAGILADHPAVRGFLWSVGTVAAAGLAVFWLARASRSREAPTDATSAAPTSAVGDAEERRLQAALASDPSDVETRLDLARLYLARQDMMKVWSETQQVLARSPENPRALAYQATVRVAMGQTDLAIDMLTKAIRSDPTLFEAHVHLALAYAQAGRIGDAEAAFDQALLRFPERAETLRPMREELKQLARTPAAAPTENPHAAIPPPPQEATPRATAERTASSAPATPRPGPVPAAPEKAVAGTIELDPSLIGKVKANAVVFVMIRDRERGGAPVAVERVDASSLPARFEIGSDSSMAGGVWPDRMQLDARLDDDGDAATRAPTDPVARLDGVKAGQRDLRLILKRPNAEVR